MPELGPLGSVRGALSNERPYRDQGIVPAARQAALLDIFWRFGERKFLQTYLCLHAGGGLSFRSGRVMKVLSPRAVRSLAHEANDILRRELATQCRSQRAEAECTQVLVEVAPARR